MSEQHTKEQMTHTLGPWRYAINKSETAFLIKDQRDRLIAMPSWHSSDDTNFPLKDESEANVRLMTLSPEFLALCVEMRDWLRPEVVKEPDRSFFWRLQRLIDQATKS